MRHTGFMEQTTSTGATMDYSVTIDVPHGISNGVTYKDDLEGASEAFGNAAYRSSYPTGTVVTLWDGRNMLDRATVTEEVKAAYRAEQNAALDAIIARANARSAARLS